MNGPAAYQELTPSRIDRAIPQLEGIGLLGMPTLLRAARAGLIALVIPPAPDVEIPRRCWWHCRPAVALIGDDPPVENGHEVRSLGPDGWAAAPFLFSWARAAIIHAAADDTATYQLAIKMARLVHRVALVETSSAHAAVWGEAFERAGVSAMIFVPKSEPHPLPGRLP